LNQTPRVTTTTSPERLNRIVTLYPLGQSYVTTLVAKTPGFEQMAGTPVQQAGTQTAIATGQHVQGSTTFKTVVTVGQHETGPRCRYVIQGGGQHPEAATIAGATGSSMTPSGAWGGGAG
jgi:hypothetical protein